MPPLSCRADRIATASPPESGFAATVGVTRLETTTNRRFAAFAREKTKSANRGFPAMPARPVKAKSLSVISASPQIAWVNTGQLDYVPVAIIWLRQF
jgi:hypothetical protein